MLSFSSWSINYKDSDRIEQLAKNDKVKKLMHKAYSEVIY